MAEIVQSVYKKNDKWGFTHDLILKGVYDIGETALAIVSEELPDEVDFVLYNNKTAKASSGMKQFTAQLVGDVFMAFVKDTVVEYKWRNMGAANMFYGDKRNVYVLYPTTACENELDRLWRHGFGICSVK